MYKRQTFNCKVADALVLIEKIAGVKVMFTIDEVKERVISMLDQVPVSYTHLDVYKRQGYDIAVPLLL